MRTSHHAPDGSGKSDRAARAAAASHAADIVNADRLVRLPEVRFLTGLGKSSIYEAVKAGTFPQAVRVTDYAVAWRKSEIDRWIAARPSVTEPTAQVESAKPRPKHAASTKAAPTKKAPVKKSAAPASRKAASHRPTAKRKAHA
ncbi:transcriptional regulator, AlpA family [Variovorax sp. YR266]|uniref:helix-turn-helix transcriptional regulator n=1 Tax=Variovorax sp. YR266 TaxID=1884386 RepID=UPI000899166B|nr:AlpA family phage regulatory protein [Variovorax sp. YR266]SDZ69514.1 transcriptional regulator, AlpA family [Variovorax sp. YR266]